MDALHLSLQDLVLCLERSIIYSSPEVLLPEVCQGRLYPFDIPAVVGPGALICQGLKDRLTPATVQLHASQDLVGEFLLYLGGSHGAGSHGTTVPAMGHAWRLSTSGTTGDAVKGLSTAVADQNPGEWVYPLLPSRWAVPP